MRTDDMLPICDKLDKVGSPSGAMHSGYWGLL